MTVRGVSRFAWNKAAMWRTVLAGVLMSTVASGCEEAQPEVNGTEGLPARPAVPVEVAVVRADTVFDQIAATGQIEAVQFIELRPEVEGRLAQILVREGTEVEQGTPLFKVDDGELKAQVARLEAERDLAEQGRRRARELIDQQALSPSELDQAEASYRSAQAQLDLQQLRLERTMVRAPFSGLVGARLVSVGDYVTTSTRLTTLQTVDPQRASFQVPERYADRLGVGQRMTFRVASVDRDFTGVVDFVDPVVQLPARTITVKAVVRNRSRALLPGMFLEARLVTEVRPEAIIVPEDAILPLQGAIYVWIVTDDNTASRRAVQLGVRTPGLVEVTRGLVAGERVVVGGLERLQEGASVRATVVEREVTNRELPAP